MFKKLFFPLIFIFVSLFIMPSVDAATRTAASCNQSDVQSAINSASAGDTVTVPVGTCSWSGGISISGIQLVGAGKSTSGTVVTVGAVTMTKHATQYTRMSGFRFIGTDQHVTVGGSASNKPYIIDNNYFFTSGSKMMYITVNGGLLHHNDFTASSGTNADVFNISTSEDWSQTPTFGTGDTAGERNIYVEDNTFTNILETAPDGDVGGRFVIRHNTYVDSSIVFHGGAPNDSSPGGGTRQFEVYNNTFDRVSNSVAINKWIWVRGSSGVIANNTMDRADSPDGSSYPNKSEIRLTLACPNSYPMQYQVGQSNQNPENSPSHPLLIFGNTGAGATDGNFITVGSSDTAGGSCSSPNNYIQSGRDYTLSNTWGWTPYTYPHPLQSSSGGGGTATPTPTPTPSPNSTPTPTPTGSPCNLFQNGSIIPTGFGAPWDVFNPGELLLKAFCTQTQKTATIGPSTYVYYQGYAWDGTQWNQQTFNCTGGSLVSNAWCPTSAQGTLPTNTSYYVAYTCNWTGSKWNCGCADQQCSQSFWQLQKIN